MAIFFTSDLHFNHANVIKYCDRPFKNKEEMNAAMIKYHNSIVTPEDTVYILGDFALNHNRACEYVKQLNGKIILIAGNHDPVHEMHRKSAKHTEMYLAAGFYAVKQYEYLKLKNGLFVLMAHLPYSNKENYEYDDRYKQFRRQDNGLPLLCGHVHEHWKKLGNQVNVGIDAHFMKYLTEEQVIKLLEDTRQYIPVTRTWRQKFNRFIRKLKGEKNGSKN